MLVNGILFLGLRGDELDVQFLRKVEDGEYMVGLADVQMSDVHTITTPVVTQLVGDNMSIPADIVSIIVSGKMYNLIQFRYRVMVYFQSKHNHKT